MQHGGVVNKGSADEINAPLLHIGPAVGADRSDTSTQTLITDYARSCDARQSAARCGVTMLEILEMVERLLAVEQS